MFHDSDIVIPACNYWWNFTVTDCICIFWCREKIASSWFQERWPWEKGPQLIPKHCTSVLAPQFAILLLPCLRLVLFPLALKTLLGLVVPFFKSGHRSNVLNYRPIIIQPTITKIYEIIILDHLYFQLRVCISLEQHGLFHNRSTITILLHFWDYLLSDFLDSCQVDCTYLDFSKAFDKVNHCLLIAKLQWYGVSGK